MEGLHPAWVRRRFPRLLAVMAEVSSAGVHALCDACAQEWLGHLGDSVDCGLHLANLTVLSCLFLYLG